MPTSSCGYVPFAIAALVLVITATRPAAAHVHAGFGGRIEHIIVVMEENRSFDHLLGFLPRVNGASGRSNPLNVTNPAAGRVEATSTANYVADCDPDHSTEAHLYKMFGPQAFAARNFSVATMEAFVEYERAVRHHGAPVHFCDVMEGFAPEHVPVVAALAEEFAVFDAFFASHAGPTWPNRLFALSGTSAGLTETGNWYKNEVGRLFPQRTIFDQVAKAGLSWKNYVNDTPWELFLETIARHPENVEPVTQLFSDARDGALPNFAFVNPRMGINVSLGLGSNDAHPVHSVALAEAFYKDIYEALRSSPQWNSTLMILIFDEGGGFSDHVAPPLDVPPPGDRIPSYPLENYTFDRLGPRIPVVAISPWIKRGTVVSEPSPRQRPTPTSAFDHTSVIATARKLLGIDRLVGPLTKRDAWAATFDDILHELDAPRADCPVHLPDAPPVAPGHLEREAAAPVNDLQAHAITSHAHLAGLPTPRHVRRERDVAEFLREAHEIHRRKIFAWKAAKGVLPPHLRHHAPPPVLRTRNATMYVGLHHTKWALSSEPDTTSDAGNGPPPFYTIATAVSSDEASEREWMCLDSGASSNATAPLAPGTPVRAAPCLISHIPRSNPDVAQHWRLMDDLTIRPVAQPTLCVSNAYLSDGLGSPVTLEVCEKQPDGATPLHQAWALQGKSPGYGSTYSHVISMGVATIHVEE